MKDGADTMENATNMKKDHKKSLVADDVEHICYLCGGTAVHEHHIFGGPCRKASDRHRLVVHLCLACHMKVHDKGGPEMQYLHRIGQQAYEEHIGSRQQFIAEFIRSYL